MNQSLALGFASLTLAAGPATAAASITIPWNLNFTLVRGNQTGVTGSGVHSGDIALQPFETQHQIRTRVEGKVEVPVIGTDLAGIDVTGGPWTAEARPIFMEHGRYRQ